MQIQNNGYLKTFYIQVLDSKKFQEYIFSPHFMETEISVFLHTYVSFPQIRKKHVLSFLSSIDNFPEKKKKRENNDIYFVRETFLYWY